LDLINSVTNLIEFNADSINFGVEKTISGLDTIIPATEAIKSVTDLMNSITDSINSTNEAGLSGADTIKFATESMMSETDTSFFISERIKFKVSLMRRPWVPIITITLLSLSLWSLENSARTVQRTSDPYQKENFSCSGKPDGRLFNSDHEKAGYGRFRILADVTLAAAKM
jgi:hypothetical protein